MDINKDYPYIQKQLAEELGVRPYDVQLIIWKYGLKKDKKYSILVETSQSGKVYKYTKYALEQIKEILEKNTKRNNFLNQLSKEYQDSLKRKKING